jgi:phosphatidylserine decarboxylase
MSLPAQKTNVPLLDNGTPFFVRHISGAVAKRIKWYVTEGQSLEQGEEFRFIKLGSLIEMFAYH